MPPILAIFTIVYYILPPLCVCTARRCERDKTTLAMGRAGSHAHPSEHRLLVTHRVGSVASAPNIERNQNTHTHAHTVRPEIVCDTQRQRQQRERNACTMCATQTGVAMCVCVFVFVPAGLTPGPQCMYVRAPFVCADRCPDRCSGWHRMYAGCVRTRECVPYV